MIDLLVFTFVVSYIVQCELVKLLIFKSFYGDKDYIMTYEVKEYFKLQTDRRRPRLLGINLSLRKIPFVNIGKRLIQKCQKIEKF